MERDWREYDQIRSQVTTFTGVANRVAGGVDWRYWLAALLVAVLAAWQ